MKSRKGLRDDLHTIFRAALRAVDPGQAIRAQLHRDGHRLHVSDHEYDLRQYEGVYVVGMGKAGAAMAGAIEDVLGTRVGGGHVIVKYGHGAPVQHVTVHEAGHPIPDEAGVRATRTLMAFVRGRGPRDLIICLLSGVGRPCPPPPARASAWPRSKR